MSKGSHLLIDCRNVPREVCLDDGRMLDTMARAARRAGANVISQVRYRFGHNSPPGFTVVVVLDESHCSAHSYADEGVIALDVFTCGNTPPSEVLAFIREEIDLGVVTAREIRRFVEPFDVSVNGATPSNSYLPRQVNSGPWVTAYTLNELQQLDPTTEFVLPICSLGTPVDEVASRGDHVLPPLFLEALDDNLKDKLVRRIRQCFPIYFDEAVESTNNIRVVELPDREPPVPSARVIAFSVDTAVEEHGPHLPLATDTIQSYSVLNRLAEEFDGFVPVHPLEYGQLTWGLPFGCSVDITAELLTEYVAGYANAILDRLRPEAMYVVDVHGSIVHRQAIVAGLKQSRVERWAFRWLHEPLVEFASERNDQHAGGVETALVERVSSDLLDARWWPFRIGEIAAGQMAFQDAVDLTPDLPKFTEHVRKHSLNGIVGDIHNYRHLDAGLMFERMMSVACTDVERLLTGDTDSQSAGGSHW